MSTCILVLHKLSSSEFWPLRTNYSTSRVKTRSYLKDQPVYRCEVQEMRRLNYFFQIYCNLHHYEFLVLKFMNVSVQWFQEMTVNNATWLNQRKQFFKDFKIIYPYCAQRASCIQGLSKNADILLKRNNVLRNVDEDY